MSTDTWGQSIPSLLEVPVVSLRLDDVPLSADVLRFFGALRVRQEISAPSVCEFDLGHAPEMALTPGVAVTVSIEGFADDIFSGEIVAVRHHFGPDGELRTTVRCFDRSHRMRQNSQIRAFTQLTVADLARGIAEPYGFSVNAAEEGPHWPRVTQQGQSDLELFDALVRAAGLWWQLDRDGLRLQAWDEEGPVRDVHWLHDLLEAVVDVDATATTSKIRALGWDPVERAVWDETAAGQRGASPAAAQMDRLGAEGRVLTGGIYAGQDHIRAVAQTELDSRGLQAATVRAVVRGDTRWRPGSRLRIADSPPDISGPYSVMSVEHTVDAASGYLCVLSSALPPTPEAVLGRGTTTTALAEVIDVADPELGGRVRIKLLALDEMESEWLPVLTLGGGLDKGLFCQPDIGDTVLIVHAADDPGRGVVLGGIFTDQIPADSAGVSDRAVRRFSFGTPDGQRMLLNRDGDAVVITNAAGSRIELTADAVLLHSVADLTIEAPGRAIRFRANTVDFERG